MKRIYLFLIALSMISYGYSQDNKPEAGKTGIGFSVFGNIGNRIAVSRMLKGGLEPGIGIGLSQGKAKTSSIDSTSIATNQGVKMGTSTATTSTPNMSVTLVPSILKHADIASNIDAFVGLQVPIVLTSKTTTNTNTKTEVANYSREVNVDSKQPSSHTVGITIVVGAQWFFYKNLSFGTICGIGAGFTGSKGDIETTTTTTNSGSANPSNSTTTKTTLTVRDNKSTTIGTFNNVVGLFLLYYL